MSKQPPTRGRYDPPAKQVAECKNCGLPVKEDTGLFDGEHWFCDYRCHGQWCSRQSGNVPA